MKPAQPPSHFPRLALGAVAVSLVTAGVQPGHAQTERSPFLGADRYIEIEAATTFNNSYGVGFEATGSVSGTASFSPPNTPTTVNYSGTAFLAAMVSFDSGSAGVLAAASGLSSMVATAGTDQFVSRSSSVINLSGNIGTPNFRPAPVVSGLSISGSGSSSTVGASLIGTNTGTERLQVRGRIGEQVANELGDASSLLRLENQLSAF